MGLYTLTIGAVPQCEPCSDAAMFGSYAAGLESIAVILALVAGGIWALYRFGLKRPLHHPSLEFTKSIDDLTLDDDWRLTQVTLKLRNTSELLVQLGVVRVELWQVLPVSEGLLGNKDGSLDLRKDGDGLVDWQRCGGHSRFERRFEGDNFCNIEPNDTEVFVVDLIVPSSVRVVKAYSYVQDKTKSKPSSEEGAGWEIQQLYVLN